MTMKRFFGILLCVTVFSACTHTNDIGMSGGATNNQIISKDISITFSAWISEEAKQAELEVTAQKKASIKCQGGSYKLVDLNSSRFNFYPTINNAISANIQCMNSVAVEVPVNRPEAVEHVKKTSVLEINSELLIEKAKKRCVDLGFKSRSEEYGKCVMQLTK